MFLKIVFTALNDTNTHFGKVFFLLLFWFFFFFSFFNSRMSFFLSWNFLFDEKFPKINGKRKHKYLAEVRNNFWKKERDIRKIKIIKWWWDVFSLIFEWGFVFWLKFCGSWLEEFLVVWKSTWKNYKYNFLYSIRW